MSNIIPAWHQSMLGMFQKCGLQFYFRYIEEIKTPPTAALTVGTSVDNAIYHNLGQKIKSGKDCDVEEVKAKFSDTFDKLKPDTDWDDEDKPDKLKDWGVKAIALHHEQIAPKIIPTHVQEHFEVKLTEDINVAGTIDHIEAGGLVVDTKTSKSPYKNKGEHILQPTMYDLAYRAKFGKPTAGFRYDVLVKTVTPKIQQMPLEVNDVDRQFLTKAIVNANKAVNAGVFQAAPEGGWWCNNKWCGYWNICKGRKK